MGNDFVLVEARALLDLDWREFGLRACRRRFGIGADGLLVLQAEPDSGLKMQMFNPDGSPDICGNGLRCVARYARERGLVSSDRFAVSTFAG
ncbi:MAG TPA: diaminopimelate epimerase, partial [Chthonomonadales bacterium]|nr:diaminopimelate epimerase [Chthonomonadales bacterium]